jgi:DNA-binding transcriptional LysR family regulator
MNLAYLKTLAEVVKQGSFTKAAKTLGISQPTVSFHLQRLEEECGSKLMERKGRGVFLTEMGREYWHFAQRVLAEQEGLERRLATVREEVAGTLALCASTIPGEFILPRLLGDFRQRYPGVDATVEISDTSHVVDLVAERHYDVGFIGAPLKRRGLALHQLCEDEVILTAPFTHPLTQRDSVTLEELEGQPLIQRTEGSGTQRSIEMLLKEAGFSTARMTCPLRVSSPQAVLTAVEAGLGLAFVSRLSATHHLQCRSIAMVPLVGVTLTRGIYYTYMERHSHPRLVHRFLEFLSSWRLPS